MIEGSIDLTQFNNWHLDLEYEAHCSPKSGFCFVDAADADRYAQIVAHIHKGIEHEQFFIDYFPHLTNHLFAVSKMLPGNILPYHRDEYAYFRRTFDVTHNEVGRIIVFLEDWQPGHISEIDGTPITNWKAGNWIEWRGTTPHMAANLGHTDRYTLQITGIINDSGMC